MSKPTSETVRQTDGQTDKQPERQPNVQSTNIETNGHYEPLAEPSKMSFIDHFHGKLFF